jgi:hypothetical protein
LPAQKLLVSLLLLALLLAACAAPPSPTPVPTNPPTAFPTPTATPAPPTRAPTLTATPTPTPPPAGIFSVQYYPPLILSYDPAHWLDRSEYGNPEQALSGNFLEHRDLEGCTIGVQGASGFYPEDMRPVTLGALSYEVYAAQANSSQAAYRAYFALDPAFGSVSAGIPIFGVRSNLPTQQECWRAAETVLATLRSAQP